MISEKEWVLVPEDCRAGIMGKFPVVFTTHKEV
jgi:hypothetical protein